MIHLDTSFLIRSLVQGSEESRTLRAWIGKPADITISAIAWSEFLCGPVSVEAVELASRLFGDPVPLGAREAATAANLFNASGRRRGSIMDCMVAAVAIESDAELATGNRRDFQRFEPLGLRVAEPNKA